MITVITPFFNSEKYIEKSIRSVLDQSYNDWELILINDGSTDKSKEIALSFSDIRIKYFEQENKGVSSARNVGLANMKGDYFCFLDSDDRFTKESLESRLKVFEDKIDVAFVDGVVDKMDQQLNNLLERWSPRLNGNPFEDLVKLKGKSFLGLTWMIKREKDKMYQFEKALSHSEDLLFFMELSKSGANYAFTNDIILHYRNTPSSAMKDLPGLEAGYRFIESKIKNWEEVSLKNYNVYKYKYRKAMFLAYLRKLKIFSAFKALI